jgi:hypothetical protein
MSQWFSNLKARGPVVSILLNCKDSGAWTDVTAGMSERYGVWDDNAAGEIVVSYKVLRKRVVGIYLTMCMHDQKEVVLAVEVWD